MSPKLHKEAPPDPPELPEPDLRRSRTDEDNDRTDEDYEDGIDEDGDIHELDFDE